MDVQPLAELELRYTALENIDFGGEGQIYGTLEGTVSGKRLNGQVRLTTLGARRPDHVNLLSLRGVMTTNDGATIWLELDGMSTLRHEDNARVFVTSCRFRTADKRYAWVNTVFAMVEGVLDVLRVGGTARAQLHECSASIPITPERRHTPNTRVRA